MPSDDVPVDPVAAGREMALPTHVVLEDRIAQRGEVSLWRGRDRRRGVDVIVKVAEPSSAAVLSKEARSLARLGGHRGILAVSAVGTGHDGSTWLVADLAAVGTMGSTRGAPLGQVLHWGWCVAGALAHAHSLGVVHGDVTPSNVFIDSHGEAVLGDFGSATITEAFDEIGATMAGGISGHQGTSGFRSTPGHRGTRGQDKPGQGPAGLEGAGFTPRFAAPERRAGDPPSPAGDVYGLGSSLLWCLTDEPPRTVATLLRRCMAPRPGRRPSAAAVHRRLRRWGVR